MPTDTSSKSLQSLGPVKVDPNNKNQNPAMIDTPTVGGTVQTLSTAQDGNDDSLAGAQQNVSATAVAMVQFLNAQLQKNTDARVADYNLNMANGTKNMAPFVMPRTYVYEPADGKFGFAGYLQTGPFVVPTIPLSTFNASDPAAPKIPNVIDIGAHISGDFYTVGPNDSWPLNKTTPPQADGHVYNRIPAAVGSKNETLTDGSVILEGGWYERVG